MDDMAVLGWNVVDAKEIKARKNQGFQKHMLIFANPEIVINGADGDTVFPRILLTNSHDGKNAFTFQAGLFRLVCSNGLVIADEQFSSMKIRHMQPERLLRSPPRASLRWDVRNSTGGSLDLQKRCRWTRKVEHY
jgi:hypothetical protein